MGIMHIVNGRCVLRFVRLMIKLDEDHGDQRFSNIS